MWKELTEIALLGTEKKALNPDIFPDAIKEILLSSGSDPESKFLEAVSIGSYFIETGRKPKTLNEEIDLSVIVEDKDIAPFDLEQLFGSITELNQPLSEVLFKLWVNTLINRDYIVGPTITVPLLKWGGNQRSDIRELIVKVLSKRGKGILPFNEKYTLSEELSHEKLWDEGTTNERKDLFSNLLNQDPQSALTLLKSTWQQEAIVSKKAFLSELREKPKKEFIPFLEEIYSDEFAYNKKEKKTVLACRKIVAEILLMFPETSICKETCKALIPSIVIESKKGLLGLGANKTKVRFNLPKEEVTPFWKAENMVQTYGFEPKDYDIGLFDNIIHSWFAGLLELLPLTELINGTEASIAQVADALLTDPQFHIKEGAQINQVFRTTLLRNNMIHKNEELAEYLTEKISLKISLFQIGFLTEEKFESLIRKKNLYNDVAMLRRGPYLPGVNSWSVSFSKLVLTKIFDHSQQIQQPYFLYNIGNEIAPFIHIDSYELLSSLYGKVNSGFYSDVWEKHVHEPILRALEIRKVLNKYSIK